MPFIRRCLWCIKSMMICQLGTCITAYKNYQVEHDVNREPLLFIRGATHIKNITMIRDVDREPLTFCTWHWMCKKYKMIRDVNQEPLVFYMWRCTYKKYKMIRDVNWEPLTNVYMFVRWPCMRSEVSLLHRLETLISIWAKLRRLL
jgi:hypothetical protein